MATAILGITDSHWTEKKPSSRKDADFRQTQARKLGDLFKLAAQLKMPELGVSGATAIVHGGDLFHQPFGKLISRRLDTWIIPILRASPVPIFTIPGNHDMKSHRTDSLEDHPYGVLVAHEIIKQVTWPSYVVMGTDPLVIITGKEFLPQGPKAWLDFLRDSQELIKIKQQLSESTGRKVHALGLAHSWWGPTEGVNRGEPVVSYNSVRNTGLDVVMYGHPHTMDGVMKIQDDYGQPNIVGPGAFIRGTLAEHDVNRQPKIAIMIFKEDGSHQVSLVSVPHQPADQVFDLEKHKRVRRQEEQKMEFIKELIEIDPSVQSLDEAFNQLASQGTTSNVVNLARQYILQARGTR